MAFLLGPALTILEIREFRQSLLGTKNVDVVLAPNLDNLKRVAEVAVAANGHVQQGEAAGE